MQPLIIDANVFFKILHQEHDSMVAEAFLDWCLLNDMAIIVPTLFAYELVSIANRVNISTERVLDMVELMEEINLTSLKPSKKIWQQAEIIANQGNPKSGFPSMYDSIYHAMAIDFKGIFITADEKHFKKSSQFGSILLLRDWEQLKY